MTDRGKRILSRIGLIYASVIWGTTFFLMKDIVRTVHPTTLVSIRFAVAAIISAGILLFLRKSLWKGFSKGVWLGIFLWFAFVFQTYGLKFTTASNSGFITGLYVPLVPIFALFLFKSRPTFKHWIAIVLSVVGLWVLTGGIESINRGDLLTLGTAAAVALHILFSERFVRGDLDPLALTFQQFTVVALISTVHALIGQHPWPAVTEEFSWLIGYLALFATVSTIFAQTVAQKHLDAVRVAIILTLEPVFAALFAWTLGGETWAAHNVVGGAIIVAAMLISEV